MEKNRDKTAENGHVSPLADYSLLLEDSLVNKEWELYIAMELFNHMDTCLNPETTKSSHVYPYIKRIEDLSELESEHFLDNTVHLREFLPRWWNLKKTYIYLFRLLKQLCIDVHVVFEREAHDEFFFTENFDPIDHDAFTKFFYHDDWDCMFKEEAFWDLSENMLQLVHIKKSFSSIENLTKTENFIYDRIDEFVGWDISKKYKLLPYEKQRGLIMNKFSDLYWNSWDAFTIKYEQIAEYRETAPVHMLVLLWKLWYIRLYNKTTDYKRWSIAKSGTLRDYSEDEANHRLQIIITDKAKSLLKEIFEVRDLVIDKIFSADYTQLRISRKHGKIHILEGKIELAGGSKRMVELLNEYPNADITFKNYNGKTDKIVILERTKMDTNTKTEIDQSLDE